MYIRQLWYSCLERCLRYNNRLIKKNNLTIILKNYSLYHHTEYFYNDLKIHTVKNYFTKLRFILKNYFALMDTTLDSYLISRK